MEGGSVTAMQAVIAAVKTALAEFSTTNLTDVIVAGLALAVPLILGWFAFRWIFGKAKGALFFGS